MNKIKNYNSIDFKDYDKFYENQCNTLLEFTKLIANLKDRKKAVYDFLDLDDSEFQLDFDYENMHVELCMGDCDVEIIANIPMKIYLDGKDISKNEDLFVFIKNGVGQEITVLC